MIDFLNIISFLFDNSLLYMFYLTMFEKKKSQTKFYWIVLAFILSDTLFWFVSRPLFGNVSYWASILRTSLTDVINFGISLFFVSGILFRILLVFSYSIIISICEEISYYVISHFTDVSIQFDTLPEITFTSISLVTDLILLLITMTIHIIKKEKREIKSKKYSALLFIIPFLSCILVFLPPFFDMNKQSPNAYLFLVIFLLVINIVNYVLLQNVLKAEYLTQEANMLTEQVNYQRQKYQQLGDAYKNIRGFMHDIKKHLFYIETCVNEEHYDRIIPYAKETMSDLEARYCTINTGNLVIDAFISNLKLQTARHNIKLTTKLKIDKELIPCDDYHMTIILGNLLDNALNACLEEHGGKININIQTVEHTFTIYITNTYHFPVGKEPPEDIENLDFIHGYGLKNVKNSAEACGGFCLINYNPGLYSVTVIIPEKKRTTGNI